ncbi:MAG: peptide chain release factor N(5)-glutamine methyltransferase [Pseudomonadota bacterium]
MSGSPPPSLLLLAGGGIRRAISEAAARFAFSETARLDAELLMAHALGITREALLLRHLDDPEPAAFAALVERRAAHEPIAYITGIRAFWTIDIAVGPGVLIPRADSETLIEAAIEYFRDRTPARILDLGTGPGTLLLAALDQWSEASGLGVDESDAALVLARENAARLGMASRAAFASGNWAAGVAGRFDLILANPPYIGAGESLPDEVRGYEPAAALFAGPDGLDDYRIIAPQLPALLAPGGAAILEIGSTQADAVTALLVAQRLTVTPRNDLGGRPRALVAT